MKMKNMIEISGNVRERYILAAALLRCLDPVRGEPTAYSLDLESQSVQAPEARVLKRKFLDSFALICATRKDGDSVSAACLEDERPAETVVRVASNAGVSEPVLNQLRDIVRSLEEIAIAAPNTSVSEPDYEILHKIIELDAPKILHYVKSLQKAKEISNENTQNLKSRLNSVLPRFAADSVQDFVNWFSKLSSIRDPAMTPDAGVLLNWILWAQKARSKYLAFLKVAFCKPDKSVPRWVLHILKLGRYAVAARVFVTIASELPELFSNISVEAIPAPLIVPFSIPKDESPLRTVLRRIPEIKADEIIKRLKTIWNVDDAEKFFRTACKVDLAVHAELQLVSFYDDNPDLKPSSSFIGISKKSCYLCAAFLSMHPDGFVVSSSHQKMYLSIPPPALNPKVYKRFKDLTNDLSKRMEMIARHDLTKRLGLARLPAPADSTAGVSFSGFTDARFITVSDVEDTAYTEADFEANNGTEVFFPISGAVSSSADTFPPARNSTGLTSEFSGLSQAIVTGPDIPHFEGAPAYPIFSEDILSIVFHCKVLGDELRQDIFMMNSCLDPLSRCPSWQKFIELLSSGDSFGINLQHFDHLMVNDRIRVCNERQFIACLHYLLNSRVLNAEVTVYDG